MNIKIILNPYANRWHAQERQTAVARAFDATGLDYTISLTEKPGQATHLAQQAVAAGYEAVIAAGGDGTVNEVVNGLIASAGSNPTHPFGILPIGTGNDLNDMAGLPRRLTTCANIIATGQTRQIDAGLVTFDGQHHYFANNCALGMEALISVENMKIERLSGNLRYLAAVARGLVKLKAWRMVVAWDNGRYQGPSLLLSICNSPRTGGLFRMAPTAVLDDGLFDFVYAPHLPRATVLLLLIRLLRASHIHHRRVIYSQSTSLTITSQPPTPIHADGELLTQGASQISHQILPGKITLLTP